MNDSEIREALISICEALKAEFGYLSSAQRNFFSLCQALKAEFPAVEERFRSQIVLSQEQPDRQRLLERVDALLEQLRKQA